MLSKLSVAGAAGLLLAAMQPAAAQPRAQPAVAGTPSPALLNPAQRTVVAQQVQELLRANPNGGPNLQSAIAALVYGTPDAAGTVALQLVGANAGQLRSAVLGFGDARALLVANAPRALPVLTASLSNAAGTTGTQLGREIALALGGTPPVGGGGGVLGLAVATGAAAGIGVLSPGVGGGGGGSGTTVGSTTFVTSDGQVITIPAGTVQVGLSGAVSVDPATGAILVTGTDGRVVSVPTGAFTTVTDRLTGVVSLVTPDGRVLVLPAGTIGSGSTTTTVDGRVVTTRTLTFVSANGTLVTVPQGTTLGATQS